MTRMIITLLKVIVLCTVFSINCLGLSDLHYYEYGERKEFPIGTEFAFGSTPFDLVSFQSLQKQITTPNTLSNLKQTFWIKVPVSAYDIHEKAVFTFSNSQINEIKVWWVDEKDSIIQEMPFSGDHHPFMNRDAKVGFFAFYVPANSKVKYFIAAIDKREEIFFCNFHKYSNFQFTRRVQSESLVYGGILGVVGIIFFLTIILSFYVRERLYFIYGGFLLLMLFHTTADFALFNRLFGWEKPLNTDIWRPISAALAVIFYSYFIQRIFQTSKISPRLYQIFKIYTYFNIGVVIFSFIYYESGFMGSFKYYMVVFSHATQLGMILLLFIIGIFSVSKKVPMSSLTLVSVILFIIGNLFFRMYEYGIVPDVTITQHQIPFIYGVDTLLMGIIVVKRFSSRQRDAILLEAEIIQNQIEYRKRLEQMKEREMQRVSQILHDNVGADISALRYVLESKASFPDSLTKNEVFRRASEIAEQVRNISHSYSPTVLKQFGLDYVLTNIVNQFNKIGKTKFQLEILGDTKLFSSENKFIVLQIIQECCHNIIKHAEAENAIIQILIENNQIEIIIEDNGKGFQTATTTKGLGLLFLTEIVSLKDGTIQIDSNIENETKINICIPNP
ncbi:MAG: 7TM diverse intracellular signaling domain-containing protein [Bacteroidota bacterium]|jgi:signal transduction histidine kinase